jgi:hypothetical protein
MEVIATVPRYGLDRQMENDKKASEEFVKLGAKLVDVDTMPFRAKVKPIQDRVAKESKAEDVLARIRELEK